MNIVDLKTFEAVLRAGSMKKAAVELHTVQSNISTRIKALESELNVTLLQRQARGVVPTPAGLRFLPFAIQIVKLLSDAKAAAVDDGIPKGRLVVGSLETTTALHLSPILTEYLHKYPQVHLTLRTSTTSELVKDVLDSKLDGAFVAGPVNHSDLDSKAIFNEELVLVTGLSIQSPDDLTRFQNMRMVVFQVGCSYRKRLETYLETRGIITTEPLEFGALDAVISCVAAGIGITLLPKDLVDTYVQAGKVLIHDLPEDTGFAQTLFVWRKDSYVTSAMKTFLELATNHN